MINRSAGLHALSAIGLALVLALPAPAQAETTSFEDAAAALGASCGKDIDENCRGVNLDATRLKECLSRNRDVVSAQCKEDYGRILGAIQQRAAARAGVFKACERDAGRLCGGAQKAELLQCLGSAKRGVSIQCTKTMTDAGYR